MTTPDTPNPSTPATDAGTLLERATAATQVDAWIAEATAAGEVEDGVLPDWLAELVDLAQADLKTKAERTGLRVRRLGHDADAIRAEMGVLAKRLQAAERAQERLKRYLQLCLEQAGETKVQTPLVTVAVQQNPPSVRGELPAETLQALWEAASPLAKYVPASVTLDKRAALDAFKRGEALPDGLTVERSASLRVR